MLPTNYQDVLQAARPPSACETCRSLLGLASHCTPKSASLNSPRLSGKRRHVDESEVVGFNQYTPLGSNGPIACLNKNVPFQVKNCNSILQITEGWPRNGAGLLVNHEISFALNSASLQISAKQLYPPSD